MKFLQNMSSKIELQICTVYLKKEMTASKALVMKDKKLTNDKDLPPLFV